MNDLLALDIANTPVATIMLMELPDHFSLVADYDDTVQGSVTPEMLAVSIALVERGLAPVTTRTRGDTQQRS